MRAGTEPGLCGRGRVAPDHKTPLGDGPGHPPASEYEISPYNFSFDIILRLLQSPVRRLTKHLNGRNHVRQAHRKKTLPETDWSRDRRLSVGSRHHRSGSSCQDRDGLCRSAALSTYGPSAPPATAKFWTRRPSIRPSKLRPRRAAASFAFRPGAISVIRSTSRAMSLYFSTRAQPSSPPTRPTWAPAAAMIRPSPMPGTNFRILATATGITA